MAEPDEVIVERCQTGVVGLDELLEGGLPRGRVVLLAGRSGTGKTILGGQFLYNGVKKFDEPGVLVSLEQHPKMLKMDLKVMGFDLEPLEETKEVVIIDSSLSRIGLFSQESPKKEHTSDYVIAPSKFSVEVILAMIRETAEEIGAKRVIIDSFSSLDSLIETRKAPTGFEHTIDIRRNILSIVYGLQSLDTTTILISDLAGEDVYSKHGIVEYIVDGIITLHYVTRGVDAGGRFLVVEKMRVTNHSQAMHPISFNRGRGIQVLSPGAMV
ncbi:MAG: ATPase domain-containing protein [Candidatus Altiarchaeota archaeon]